MERILKRRNLFTGWRVRDLIGEKGSSTPVRFDRIGILKIADYMYQKAPSMWLIASFDWPGFITVTTSNLAGAPSMRRSCIHAPATLKSCLFLLSSMLSSGSPKFRLRRVLTSTKIISRSVDATISISARIKR